MVLLGEKDKEDEEGEGGGSLAPLFESPNFLISSISLIFPIFPIYPSRTVAVASKTAALARRRGQF